MSPEKRETPIRGYAIVERTVWSEDLVNGVQTDRYELFPGSVLMFTGTYEDPTRAVAPRSGKQDELVESLEAAILNRELIQAIVILDQNTGSLLVTDGSQENSWGLSSEFPRERRHFSLDSDNQTFSFTWGESQQEVEDSLRELQSREN